MFDTLIKDSYLEVNDEHEDGSKVKPAEAKEVLAEIKKNLPDEGEVTTEDLENALVAANVDAETADAIVEKFSDEFHDTPIKAENVHEAKEPLSTDVSLVVPNKKKQGAKVETYDGITYVMIPDGDGEIRRALGF